MEEMSYEQRYAALELNDKLSVFAQQYNLPESWVDRIRAEAINAAKESTNIDITEA